MRRPSVLIAVILSAQATDVASTTAQLFRPPDAGNDVALGEGADEYIKDHRAVSYQGEDVIATCGC